MGSELQWWMHQVAEFGGRTNEPLEESFLTAIRESNLGRAVILPTSAANPVFQPTVTLAELKLPAAIRVDVSFAYTNIEGALPNSTALDVGDGFVRITWGVPGAPQQMVDVDGGQGWTHPFVASYLRVEYVPIDTDSIAGKIIPGGQPRDLGIRAIIAPCSGAAQLPLKKTVFYADVAQAGFAFGRVPRFATSFRVALTALATADWEFGILAGGGGFAILQQIFVNPAANAPGWPSHIAQSSQSWTVPQRSATGIFSAIVGALSNPSIVYELAI